MPFASESQRRFMWLKHPKIAQRWVDEGAKSKGLPMHKNDTTRTKAMKMLKKKRGK